MKEQSHKEEMSAAIRGDFQRLRARGVSTALAPRDPAEPDASRPDDPPDPSVEEQARVADAPSPEPDARAPATEPAPYDEQEASAGDVESEAPAAHLDGEPPADTDSGSPAGWLGRLLGRS